MTRAEILDCLTDRPCEVCKFHESGRCERWDCVFEEKPDEMTREEAIGIMKVIIHMLEEKYDTDRVEGAVDLAIEALSAEPQKTGKWIYTKAVSTGEIIWSECSVCGEGEHGCAKRMKFCPNCGAKMQEVESDGSAV